MAAAFAALDALLAPWACTAGPGGVVAAARGGRVVLRRAFGMASVEHGVANQARTRFPIGSVTKHMTAAALLALCDEGRMVLDDRIGRWLPELQGDTGLPTLRQLATHAGGQRCYLDIAFCDGFAMQPAGAALAAQARQRGANFAAGAGQCYSNGGYWLLSLAIERAAGRAFEDVLRERLFEPVGLPDTEGVRSDAPLRTGVAAGHVALAGGGWMRGLNVSEERLGDGCIVSTADDLLRWALHLRTTGLLRRLAEPSKLAPGFASRYGFGLLNESWRGLDLVGHGGGVMGANSHVLSVPQHELDVVALCNGPTSAKALALAVLADLLAPALREPLPAPRASAHPWLLGHWRSPDSGRVLQFAALREDGAGHDVLGLGFQGAPAARLLETRATSGLAFAMPTATGEFGFRGDEGRLELIDAGKPDGLERFEPSTELPTGLAGTYRSDEAQAELKVEPDGKGGLTLHGRGTHGFNRFVGRPLGADLLTLGHALMPWSAVAHVQREGAAAAALHIGTGRTRRLSFVRVA